jgi:hypothetical protein
MAAYPHKVWNGGKTLIFSFLDFASPLARGKTYTPSIYSLNFRVEPVWAVECLGVGERGG